MEHFTSLGKQFIDDLNPYSPVQTVGTSNSPSDIKFLYEPPVVDDIRQVITPIKAITPAGLTNNVQSVITSGVREPIAAIQPITPAGIISSGSAAISSGISTTNPNLSTGPGVKVLSSNLVDVNSIVMVDGLPMGEINIYVEGVIRIITKQDGKFTVKRVPENADILISSSMFPPQTFEASKVPSIVNLEAVNSLADVIIKPKSNSNLFWILLFVGVITYGGYKYSLNKDKKIVKTKI
jgi:hypothetical protein